MADREVRKSLPVLKAKARDVRTVASLLRPISLTKICQVNVSEAGLQVVTEINGVLQANAYIGAGLFDEYTYTPPQEDMDALEDDESDLIGSAIVTTFDVSLETWLQCLNIYNTAAGVVTNSSSNNKMAMSRDLDMRRAPFMRGRTVVEMIYMGRGHPLILEIKDGNVTTRCELATFFQGELEVTEMPFSNDRVVGQVIITSKRLTEALLSIDNSCRNVTFEFMDDSRNATGLPQTPPRNNASTTIPTMIDEDDGHEIADTRRMYEDEVGKEMMRITAEGDHGSVELDFPNRNRVFESFSLLFDCRFTYSFANIQHCLRALQTSLKCSIRIDDQGVMIMQCLFPDKPINERGSPEDDQAGPERQGFVELRMLSVAEDTL